MANKKKVTKTVTTVTTTVTTEPTGEKTHIICVLDRSGSMSGIMQDSIGGFNTFLKQQRELPDKATITVSLFDDQYELLYDNIDIKEVKDITEAEWYPRGTTALYDAICKTINAERAKIAKMRKANRPNKVLVCIVTDGHENSSYENDITNTQNLIKDCENNDWNFIYLAANQDAFAVGQSFGISGANTFTYAATADGVTNMSQSLNSATASYRSMSSTDVNFKVASKSLIDEDDDDDDEKNDIQDMGTLTTNNTGTVTIDNS